MILTLNGPDESVEWPPVELVTAGTVEGFKKGLDDFSVENTNNTYVDG